MKPSPTSKPTTLLARARSTVSSTLAVLAEGFGLAFSASGAAVAAVLGKLVIGIVLGVIALGFLLRLMGRQRSSGSVAQRSGTTLAPRLFTALVAVGEVVAVVEATNLPIRFNQEGFHMGHWYLVVLTFFAAYFLQLPLVSKLFGWRRAKSAA